MKIRLGYTGNSKVLKDCATNKTVSVSALNKETDNKKKIAKLRKVAKDNILNTLKVLENNKKLGISVYGLSPKLFPLANYPELEYFNYIDTLKAELTLLGDFIKVNKMRVDIILESTIIINSMSDKLFDDAIKEISYQNALLNYMGLDESYKIVVNVGRTFGNKENLMLRFRESINSLNEALKNRIVFKNEDKSIDPDIMLDLCNNFSIPFFINADDVDSKVLIKCIESWKKEDVPALLGLYSNSGIVNLSKLDKDVDVILQNSNKEINILKFDY